MPDTAMLSALDAAPSLDTADDPHPHAITVAPLAVSGLVVRKADLIATLQTFVPTLADVTLLDADHVLLHLGPPAADPKER